MEERRHCEIGWVTSLMQLDRVSENDDAVEAALAAASKVDESFAETSLAVLRADTSRGRTKVFFGIGVASIIPLSPAAPPVVIVDGETETSGVVGETTAGGIGSFSSQATLSPPSTSDPDSARAHEDRMSRAVMPFPADDEVSDFGTACS